MDSIAGLSIAVSLALFLLAGAAGAGSYRGLGPGVSSRMDVDATLGQPLRVVTPGTELEYDSRGTGRRILVGFDAADQIVRFIELEPDETYPRSDYAAWFRLKEPSFAQRDNTGSWTEYYLVQGVSLHFAGDDDRAQVRFFRHFDRDALLAGEATATGRDQQPSAAASTLPADRDSCAEFFGVWRWFNGAMVECLEDGRCVANNGYSGTWHCSESPDRLEIHWTRAGQSHAIVDTLVLSEDRWELHGRGSSGHRRFAQRAEFSGADAQTGCDGLVGNWRWHGGTRVECTSDGACSASNGLSGNWRCILPSGRFEIRWGRPGRPNQFTDTLVMSPLGSYLSGTNQFGVAVGAVRE
jgi:hypothetical protein